MTVPAVGPDKWGDIGLVPTGLTEDRYVAAVEVREVNDIPKSGGDQHGRRPLGLSPHDVFERGARAARSDGADEGTTSWPIHEVGRNADIFPPEAAGSSRRIRRWRSPPATCTRTAARRRRISSSPSSSFPKGYKPLYRRSTLRLGNGIDIDVKPNQANQELHAYAVLQEHTKIITFEPHMHAPGVRMCLEAIWGHNIQTLNCVGYDHNWVKQYVYADDAAPLLPKGTIVHIIGFLDTTPANRNPADPRNWAGGGRRSVANMFIDLGYSVSLTEEQFQAEMAKRRENMKSRNDYDIGCPLCWAPPRCSRRSGPRGAGEPVMRRCVRAPRRGATVARPLVALLLFQVAGAQTRFTYSNGQSVSPSYEGWRPNEDGSFTMFFGYMNSNWLEEFDMPIGPDNTIEPGGPDQGQPTHFYPRRNPFLFTIRVPKDFGEKEMIWTLTTNGKTERAFASLKSRLPDQQAGDLHGSRRRPRQPARRASLQHSAGSQGGRGRSGGAVKVGEPVTLAAIAGDPDNLPARRDGDAGSLQAGRRAARAQGLPATPPPSGPEPGRPCRPRRSRRSGPGLRLSWIVYRGKAAAVTFTPSR